MNELAAQRGEKLAEMALGWLLHHKEVTSVLIGASRSQQILDNIKAISCAPFTEEELKVKELRDRLQMSSELFSVYRDRLKRKGVIDTREYGKISFALPRFAHFVEMQKL